MTWWSVVLMVLGVLVADLTVLPWTQRVAVRRQVRAGHPPVSARSLAPARGTLPARWTPCRVTREGDRLVLRRSSDLWTASGWDLLSIAGPGRELPFRESLATASGTRAIPLHSSAGQIEVVGHDEAVTWLTAQLAPADPA